MVLVIAAVCVCSRLCGGCLRKTHAASFGQGCLQGQLRPGAAVSDLHSALLKQKRFDSQHARKRLQVSQLIGKHLQGLSNTDCSGIKQRQDLLHLESCHSSGLVVRPPHAARCSEDLPGCQQT